MSEEEQDLEKGVETEMLDIPVPGWGEFPLKIGLKANAVSKGALSPAASCRTGVSYSSRNKQNEAEDTVTVFSNIMSIKDAAYPAGAAEGKQEDSDDSDVESALGDAWMCQSGSCMRRAHSSPGHERIRARSGEGFGSWNVRDCKEPAWGDLFAREAQGRVGKLSQSCKRKRLRLPRGTSLIPAASKIPLPQCNNTEWRVSPHMERIVRAQLRLSQLPNAPFLT